jgi:hypothetical protein
MQRQNLRGRRVSPYHERGYLDVTLRRASRDRFKNGFERSAANLPVKRARERFVIDIHRVDIRKQFLKRSGLT